MKCSDTTETAWVYYSLVVCKNSNCIKLCCVTFAFHASKKPLHEDLLEFTYQLVLIHLAVNQRTSTSSPSPFKGKELSGLSSIEEERNLLLSASEAPCLWNWSLLLPFVLVVVCHLSNANYRPLQLTNWTEKQVVAWRPVVVSWRR